MESRQPSGPQLFLDVPFAKRWEYHRDTINRLYITEDQPIEDVADTMKRIYWFDASVRQYKYHLKKWNISKSVSSDVKKQAVQTLGKRIRDGTVVGGIRYKGVEIDKKKLRRYIQDDARLNAEFKLTSPVFYLWNLLHRVSKATLDHASPGASDFSTPSNFSVFSPPAVRDHPTPGDAASPANSLSPTTQAISVKTHFDRSRSFIQGEMGEFMKGMSPSDRRVATTWLHQFWLFAFITSKHWGRGPQKWTTDLLRMTEFSERLSLPGTTAAWRLASEAMSPSNDTGNARISDHQQLRAPQPSSLCRWCIHVEDIEYEHIPSPPPEEDTEYNVEDSDNWPRWTEEPCTVVERLRDALEDNSFSDMNTQDLPLSAKAIAIAAAASPDAMSVEAMGFAIMARNANLVTDLVEAANEEDLDLSSIYPYHLAASYLDGSSICCDMFTPAVLLKLDKQNGVNRLYMNEDGHTVLDSLMLTILKGHTSCTPVMIDERLKHMTRFPGEEVDICGRWDADSPCLRALNARGVPRIPFEWKHMFCHTSVQAICHSIVQLFARGGLPNVNTPSGLFTKTCFTCGDRLVLGPLHTLVLITFNLAHRGCQEETLFGMVACLVCLLVNGADPTAKANLSVGLLLGTDDEQGCSHEPLDPVELGEKVPRGVRNSWSADKNLGWDCFMAILGFAQRRISRVEIRVPKSNDGVDDFHTDYRDDEPDEEDSDSENSYDINYDEGCNHLQDEGLFCHTRRHLAVLWSAVQTELVSYRRLRDGDSWISENFSLTAVRDGANADAGFSRLPLLERRMMKAVCRCGMLFCGNEDMNIVNIATTDKACSFYFSNMEDWSRSTYYTL